MFWDEEVRAPEMGDMYWDKLLVDQQEAVSSLCYFVNSWNWISLVEWQKESFQSVSETIVRA